MNGLNKHSGKCRNFPKCKHFDYLLKTNVNLFSANSVGVITTYKLALLEDKEDIIKELLGEDYEKRMIQINSKYPIHKLNSLTSAVKISEEDLKFIDDFAKLLKNYWDELEYKQMDKRADSSQGNSLKLNSTKLHLNFIKKIPPRLLNETIMQIVRGLLYTLDMYMDDNPTFENHLDVFDKIGPNKVVLSTRNILKGEILELYEDVDENSDVKDIENKKTAMAIIEDDELWSAAVYVAKGILYDAEKIKIAKLVDSAQEINADNEADYDDNGNTKNNDRDEYESREKWQIKANTVSSFGSLSKEARSILLQCTTGEKGILGMEKIENTLSIHKKLLELRREKGLLNSIDLLEELNRIRGKEQWANDLYNILIADDSGDKRATIFVAYCKNSLDYSYHNTRDNVTYINHAAKKSTDKLNYYRDTVFDIDTNNNICVFNSNGNIDKKRLRDTINIFSNIGSNGILGIYFDTYSNEFSDNYYDYFVNSPDAAEHKRNVIDYISDAFNLHLKEGDKVQLEKESSFELFIKDMTILSIKILSKINNSRQNFTINDLLNSQEFKFKNIITRTITYTSEYSSTSPVERSLRYKGSTYFTDVIPSSMQDTLERFRYYAFKSQEDSNGNLIELLEYIEQHYLNSPLFATKISNTEYIIKNKLLHDLYYTKKKDLNNPNSFFNKFTTEVRRGLGTEDKEFENFTEKDNFMFSFIEFARSVEWNEGLFCHMPLFVTGDSNASRFLTVHRHKNLGVNSFALIAYNEIEAMIELKNMGEELGMKDLTKYKFSYFPALNGQTFNIGDTIMSLEDVINIVSQYQKQANYVLRTFSLKDIDDETEEYKRQTLILNDLENKNALLMQDLKLKIETILDDGFKRFKEDCRKAGILAESKLKDAPALFSYRVVKTIENNKYLYSNEKFDASNSRQCEEILKDWYYNTKYNLIQQLNLLTVSPAFYKGTQDMQKRYKQNIASGNRFDLAHPIFNNENNLEVPKLKVTYVLDIESNTLEFDEDFDKMLDYLNEKATKNHRKPIDKSNYERSSLTDGQGWRSFNSYRQLMKAAGNNRWTLKHEQAYNIIMLIRQGKKDRREGILEIESLNVVFQPLKLHYYGFENINGRLIPVLHKYAEIPLIPELIPNCAPKLEAMSQYMDENGVDLCLAGSGVKVGRFNEANITGINDVNEIKNILKNTLTHDLELNGLRELNLVPNHNDITRARGTLFIKHGYMGLSEFESTKASEIAFIKAMTDAGVTELKLTDTISIPLDGNITKLDMMNLWGVLGSSGFIRSLKTISRELGSIEDISKVLTVLKEIDGRSAIDDVLAFAVNDKGELNIPPSELSVAFDTMASLLSKLRKDVVKQQIKGGSLVLASCYGFEDVLKLHYQKDEKGNIINVTQVDCAIPFDFSYTGFDGTKIELDYAEYCDPITGMLLDENGNAVEPGEGKSKLEKKFPGILDMIAYRIPTEAPYSIINMRAKRFFPKSMGGIIMVPTMFTTIAGFDFDIDKLYYFTREYELSKIGEESTAKNWENFYANSAIGKVIKPFLKEARDLADAATHRQLEKYYRDEEALKKLSAEANKKYTKAYQEYEEKRKTLLIKKKKALGLIPLEEGEKIDLDAAREECEKARITFSKAVKEVETVQALNTELLESLKEIDQAPLYLFQYWEDALELMKNVTDNYTSFGNEGEKVVIRTTSEENENLRNLLLKEGKTVDELFPKTANEAYSEFLSGVGWDITDRSKFKWKSDYDYSKSVLDNSRSAVNNMMFDYMQQRLSDPNTAIERYTPGGFKNFEDHVWEMLVLDYATEEELANINSLEDLEKLAELFKNRKFKPEYDPTELSTIAHYQTYNSIYDKLIGVTANISINLRPVSLTETYQANSPIRFGSEIPRSEKDANIGSTLNKRFLEGLDTELNTTETLTSSVDAVKKALLEYYGINERNIVMTCFALKTGASPVDIGLLLKLPLIRKAYEIVLDSNGITSMTDALTLAFKDLTHMDATDSEVTNTISGWENEDSSDYIDDYLVSDVLVRNIVNGKLNKSIETKNQIAVLHIARRLIAEANNFSDQVSITKNTSTNSVGSSAGYLMNQMLKALQVYTNMLSEEYSLTIKLPNGKSTIIDPDLFISLHNPQKALEACMNSPYMMEQIAFSCEQTFFVTTLGKYFPYFTEGYRASLKALSNLTKRKYLSVEISDEFIKDFTLFMLTRYVTGFKEEDDPVIYIDDKDTPIRVNNRDFYTTVFPTYLEMIMELNKAKISKGENVDDYSKIDFLNALLIGSKSLNKEVLQILIPDIGSLKKAEKSALRQSWAAMCTSDDPILADLGKKLFYYSYFLAGLTFSPLSFASLVSTTLKLELNDYLEFFNKMFNVKLSENSLLYPDEDSNPVLIKDFLKVFIRNNYSKYYQFTKSVYRNNQDLIDAINEATDESTDKHSFEVDATVDDKASTNKKILKSKLATPVEVPGTDDIYYEFMPSVYVNGRLYICDNGNEDALFNVDKNTNKVTYYEVELKTSNKDYSDIKNVEDEEQKSKTVTSVKEARLLETLESYMRQIKRKLREYYNENQLYTKLTDDDGNNQHDGEKGVANNDNNKFAYDAEVTAISNDIQDTDGIPAAIKLKMLQLCIDILNDNVKDDSFKDLLVAIIDESLSNKEIEFLNEKLELLRTLYYNKTLVDIIKTSYINKLQSKETKLTAYKLKALINYYSSLIENFLEGAAYLKDYANTSPSRLINEVLAEKLGFKFTGTTDLDKYPILALGGTFDDVTRQFFKYRLLGIKMNDLPTEYENLTPSQVRAIHTLLAKFETYLKAKFGEDCLIITDEFAMAAMMDPTYTDTHYQNRGLGIVGKPDMLIVLGNNVHILDFKTSMGFNGLFDSKTCKRYLTLTLLYKLILLAYHPELNVTVHLLGASTLLDRNENKINKQINYINKYRLTKPANVGNYTIENYDTHRGLITLNGVNIQDIYEKRGQSPITVDTDYWIQAFENSEKVEVKIYNAETGKYETNTIDIADFELEVIKAVADYSGAPIEEENGRIKPTIFTALTGDFSLKLHEEMMKSEEEQQLCTL